MVDILADEFLGSFGPDEIKLLADAFADAWHKTLASGAYSDGGGHKARKILANHIITAAMAGERNRRELCDGALAHLAQAGKL